MTFSTKAAVAAAFLACLPALANADAVRITTEAEFREAVVGKRLTIDDNWFKINKNGSLRGKFGGETLKGSWAWRDGYFCRTLTTHSKNTDCQLWLVDGKAHNVTRARGKGNSFTYMSK